MNPSPELRSGNRSLAYLIKHYDSSDPKISFLVESLLRLSQDFSDLAESSTKDLIREYQFRGNLDIMSLTHCVFDLLLTILFQETIKYAGKNEVASLFVDSVLYEVTGCEPSRPTEAELVCGETHRARGIHKFMLARDLWPHIGDATAWLFGKECSTIQGEPSDISIILSVSLFALSTRVHAKWIIESVFYGTVPTEAQRQALEASLIEQERELIESFRRVAPET